MCCTSPDEIFKTEINGKISSNIVMNFLKHEYSNKQMLCA